MRKRLNRRENRLCVRACARMILSTSNTLQYYAFLEQSDKYARVYIYIYTHTRVYLTNSLARGGGTFRI